MKTVAATLTSKGQITIPHEVRERLGLRTGDHLLFRIAEASDESASPWSGTAEKLPDLVELAGMLPAPPDRRGQDWETIREKAWQEELRPGS